MKRLRDLREDKDLRQADVSAATGIDQRTLSNYETGKTKPDSDALIRLADFYGVSIDYLVGRSDQFILSNSYIVQKINELQRELEHIKQQFQAH